VTSFDWEEYRRWLEQARHTLNSARRDLEARDYAWACFKAQQAGEYAVKGVLRGAGRLGAGHSILKLLRELEETGMSVSDMSAHARTLDRHYIPPRYPDAYPAGSPFEFYDEKTAHEAIEAAAVLIDFASKVSENVAGS
jgi:HEPN domain-containing protein